MPKYFVKTIATLILCFYLDLSFGQALVGNNKSNPSFPQQKLNSALQNAFNNSTTVSPLASPSFSTIVSKKNNLISSPAPILQYYSGKQFPPTLNSLDTIVVGALGNDTLLITGNFTHTGPIWVLNDGVLIFYNATVIDTGDIYVFGNGKLIADSSSLTFPQQYFYERGLYVLQNGYAKIHNCSFNYSGFSHNLLVADSAVVDFYNIHQNDFTTCGLFGNPSITINECNITGEYILTGYSNASFKNCDTLILWHYFPDSAVVNYSFPQGDTVYNYVCNKTINGVTGIEYNVSADSCHNVMWAMMPVNGSDITISNSTLRLIGCWFERGDSVTVSGIYNNSTYTNFVMPVNDRNLHLINSTVQTWSLYVFDSSHINIDNCQLGEVGTQQSSTVTANPFLLDGSGGYFWSTDTSGIIAAGVTIYTTARSERKGIFVLAYSWQPFMAPAAIGNSLMVCVQNDLVQDPIPYEASVAWMQNIATPDTANINAIVPVTGSAWIDNGPLGGWMNFGSYSLYYQLQGAATWIPITIDSLTEIHNNVLANWNTTGLQAGNYLLRLLVKNDLLDSVEAISPIVLQQFVSITNTESSGADLLVYPNPAQSEILFSSSANGVDDITIEVFNALGKIVKSISNKNPDQGNYKIKLDVTNFSDGIYYYKMVSGEKMHTGKFAVTGK